ncbi:formate dehydrogenase subunit gamma [Jannaschia sp. CCS1]|uniref:formate dehydrogenase subunit gamma n=1 Tax=Jannaschia sp. (strain CCS1) TaxID=290400 RepID=UPI000053A084|nr:formate dehydrogenase subunit gamma [Jannaschia sp. CCS1]ABD55477.1 formate dehydrogenase gamma subunit [Jannaschia sp. CCS1]
MSATAAPPKPDDLLVEVDAIIQKNIALEGPLLPILHDVQAAFGYVPDDARALIATALNITEAELHGVISFYHDFRRKPAGKRVLKICRAEACQAMGANAMSDAVLAQLGLGWGETAADGGLTVEPIYCLGLCACGPAAMIDGKLKGRVTADSLIAEVSPQQGAGAMS